MWNDKPAVAAAVLICCGTFAARCFDVQWYLWGSAATVSLGFSTATLYKARRIRGREVLPSLTFSLLLLFSAAAYCAAIIQLTPPSHIKHFLDTPKPLRLVCEIADEPRCREGKTTSLIHVRSIVAGRDSFENPSAGKPVDVKQAFVIEQPDLKRLQPEVTFTGTKGIPLQAYKPFIHVPYVSSDEKGTQAGVLLTGADPVGIIQMVNLLYGFKSDRAGYDINLTNKSFWPTLTARIYDTSVEGNTIGNGKDYWYRERGGELSCRDESHPSDSAEHDHIIISHRTPLKVFQQPG